MKVFYVNRLDYNTADVFYYLSRLMKNKDIILFVAPDEKFEFHINNEHKISENEKLIRRIWNYDNYVMKIFRFIKKQKPTIIHFDFELRVFGSLKTALKFPLLLLLIKSTKTKVVVTLHTVFVFNDGSGWKIMKDSSIKIPEIILRILAKMFIKIICNLSDKIIVYNKSAKLGLIEYFRIKSNKIEVMNLAVTIDQNPINIEKKEKFSLKFQRKNIILCFGTISPRKGLEIAIKAMKEISKKFPDYVLVIAGISTSYNKPYENSLHDLVKKLKLENNVFFVGYLDGDEIKIIFEMAEMVLYGYKPSSAGTMGLHYAIRYHKPVIVSKIDTFCDILEEDDALFVEPDNEDEMIIAVSKVIHNPGLKRKLRDRMKNISEKYSWKKTAVSHVELYKKLV